MFEFTVLGANSALPSRGRFPSAHILRIESCTFLIDCGEGAQVKMSQFKIKSSKLDRIFISHLHGDHIFGLPGLLTSYNLSGRKRELTIYGPTGIRQFIEGIFSSTNTELYFPLDIVEFEPVKHFVIYEDDIVEVWAFPLKHRLPTSGYLFKEKPKRPKIKKEKISEYGFSIDQIKEIVAGKDITLSDGTTLSNKLLVTESPKPKSFAYCSDTIYDEEVIPYIEGVDMLYHEATYMHELQTIARERMHSTTIEAAEIAKLAGASKLIIGHYSSRYHDLSPLLEEAKSVFSASELALEGSRYYP